MGCKTCGGIRAAAPVAAGHRASQTGILEIQECIVRQQQVTAPDPITGNVLIGNVSGQTAGFDLALQLRDVGSGQLVDAASIATNAVLDVGESDRFTFEVAAPRVDNVLEVVIVMQNVRQFRQL